MMTDRDLLQAAARAAGWRLMFDAQGNAWVNSKRWDPLSDTADAQAVEGSPVACP